MRIDIGDTYSRIYSKDPRALAIARKVCRARPKGFQFSPKYKDGSWDGYITLMHTTSSFPTGLLGLVVPVLEERGYKVDVKHLVPSPTPKPVWPDTLRDIRLRDYQVEAANTLLKHRRGVAKMATNSGKTEVFAAILEVLDHKRAIVVVHRKELLHQTAERLEIRLGYPVGKIGDGLYDPRSITVAMIQTLHNQLDEDGDFKHNHFEQNGVVIVDECHHVSSNQMMDVLFQLPGEYRFGFSGTPLKHDNLSDMKLISATGPVLVDVTNADLIDQGHSAVPVIHLHDVIDLDEDGWKMGYAAAYKEFIVGNDERNELIAKIALEAAGRGEVVLVLIVQIAHGRAIEKKTGGWFSSGDDTTAFRKKMLDTMREGIPGVYVASTIFDEGVDVPAINTLILAGGGKSDLRVLQRVGRGLRKKEGANVLQVHDFIDDTNKHLMLHSEDRLDVYIAEGFKIEVATD
jgi:superfamily II DNA or RNA helicase